MKILYDHQIFCTQQYGGVSRYHIELTKELKKYSNVSIDIPALCSKNSYLAEYKNSNLYILKNKWLQRIVKLINRIYTICLLFIRHYDIIHPTWYASYIHMFCKGKMIVTIHDMIHEIYTPYNLKDVKIKKKAIYNADAIIAISENTKRDILKFYPDIPANKIRVIYHGTNHLSKNEKIKFPNIPSQYILFVGKRDGYKNAEILIRAIANIIHKKNDIVLFMVGGGDFDNKELDLIKKLKIEKNIIQAELEDAILAYLYENAICFVYPSKYEGFGFPLLEAFENNCPVISSNSSCLPEIGGNAALYFNPDNEKELMECIESMINNQELRQKYKLLGKERANMFSWKKTAKQTYELYTELLDESLIK